MTTHEAEVGQGLDVLDQGGATLQAAFGHSGRLPQWDWDAPPDPVDDGTCLTRDESVSCRHDAKLRAVKPDPSTFRQSGINNLAHVTMDDHDDLPRANEAGR